MSDFKYNPGSDKAIDNECICPILNNDHGKGYMDNSDYFVTRMDYPLHGEQ